MGRSPKPAHFDAISSGRAGDGEFIGSVADRRAIPDFADPMRYPSDEMYRDATVIQVVLDNLHTGSLRRPSSCRPIQFIIAITILKLTY